MSKWVCCWKASRQNLAHRSKRIWYCFPYHFMHLGIISIMSIISIDRMARIYSPILSYIFTIIELHIRDKGGKKHSHSHELRDSHTLCDVRNKTKATAFLKPLNERQRIVILSAKRFFSPTPSSTNSKIGKTATTNEADCSWRLHTHNLCVGCAIVQLTMADDIDWLRYGYPNGNWN